MSKIGRLSLDAFLRAHGWRIQSRPKSGPVTWRKGNAKLPQEQAIKVVLYERDKSNEISEEAGSD